LNRDGRLAWPAPGLLALFRLAGRVHEATGGAFDPSVQPLWLAQAKGLVPEAARQLVGWEGVRLSEPEIRLTRPGMALTFNGIGQGWAADRIADLLRGRGFGDILVDMGEISAQGRRPDGERWEAAITLPDGTEVGRRALENRALATSAPMGTRIGSGGNLPHIIGPNGQRPIWRLVSISAGQAALADALSTAVCLMPRQSIDAALANFPGVRLEVLI